MSADDEAEQNVLSGDNYELVLPSGAVIGHRSLKRYYRYDYSPCTTFIFSVTV